MTENNILCFKNCERDQKGRETKDSVEVKAYNGLKGGP